MPRAGGSPTPANGRGTCRCRSRPYRVVTPPLSDTILAGITRDSLLTLGHLYAQSDLPALAHGEVWIVNPVDAMLHPLSAGDADADFAWAQSWCGERLTLQCDE